MIKLDFDLTAEYVELNKLLKLLGLCETGGHANLVIEDGQVNYNNEIEFRKRKKLYKGDVVHYNNHEIKIN
jgi:ribosome-associated protein